LQLLRQNEQGLIAEFARNIHKTNSAIVKFKDGSFYTPDGSFWHEEARFPGLVVEMVSSQAKEVLTKKAKAYILRSKGRISVVGLCIGVEDKSASVSVWRPRFRTEGRKWNVHAERTVTDDV